MRNLGSHTGTTPSHKFFRSFFILNIFSVSLVFSGSEKWCCFATVTVLIRERYYIRITRLVISQNGFPRSMSDSFKLLQSYTPPILIPILSQLSIVWLGLPESGCLSILQCLYPLEGDARSIWARLWPVSWNSEKVFNPSKANLYLLQAFTISNVINQVHIRGTRSDEVTS